MRLMTVTMVAIISVSLFSCSEKENEIIPPIDDNTEEKKVDDTSLLIGSWKTTFEGNEYSIKTFKEDNTFVDKGFAGGESYEDTGTWSLNPNTKKLTLTYSDGSTNDGEIVRLTATELEIFGCVYLRIDDNPVLDNPEDVKTDITGIIQGHDYVDLDLPSGTLWATMNVGANKPEDYGDVFAWGETETDWFYHWNTYKYCKGSGSTLTKYCVNSSYGTVDNKTELEPADDAATANWGGDWRMPSRTQFEELINNNNTTTSWTTLNGVCGTMIISKSNGKKMFLPAAGYGLGNTLTLPGDYGYYSSRSLNTNDSQQDHHLFFQNGTIYTDKDNVLRCYGQSVRPIIRRNKPVGPITVTITRAAEPEAITCTLYGSVSGFDEDVEVGFIYSSKSTPSEIYGKRVKTTSKGEFSLTLKGVLDDQTYYYRAYALVDNVYYLSDVKNFTTEQLTYELDGVTYKFIKVEGGDMPPFSIMQTEYPCIGSHTVKIAGVEYPSIDGGRFGNNDGTVIITEFRSFWLHVKQDLGLPIRLPHRTEWVYAASGGAMSHGFNYSGSDVIDNVAWYKGNSEGSSHPVAMKQPNELGLYDMSGNYAELCFKEGSLNGTNSDTTFIDGPYCGGSWKDVADDCKVTSWKKGEMGGAVSGTRISEKNAFDSSYIGLRLVYSRNAE